MEKNLLIIIFIVIFLNISLVEVFGVDKKSSMEQIIEIDNDLSRNKIINTSNPNIIVVEQYNPIYLHYIKNCRIIFIKGKEDASIEYFFNDNFRKGKNTLLIVPYSEREYKLDFNCTSNPLIIKSLSESGFNIIKFNMEEMIIQINKSITNQSKKLDESESNRKKDSEKLGELTNRTRNQDEGDLIKECKEHYRLIVWLLGIGYTLITITGIFKNKITKSKTLIQKYCRKNKKWFVIIALIIWIFIIYFEFSKNPLFC